MRSSRINLHVHSTYSDGRNTIKQIVRKAAGLNLSYLAITDHFSNSWKANVISTLDDSDKIHQYLEEISLFSQKLKSEKKDLILLKGIEIDIGSDKQYVLKLINPTEFDLILFEYLEDPSGIAYIKDILLSWQMTLPDNGNMPLLGLAHFDPSFFLYGSLDVLMNFLIINDIFFEFNSSYPQGYSRRNELFFQKLRNTVVKVSIGCDSHDLNNLDNINEPLEMINFYELQPNYSMLIEELKHRTS